MNHKPFIVAVGVIIVVASIVILASNSGTRFRRTMGEVYSGTVTMAAGTNGMVAATNSTSASQPGR